MGTVLQLREESEGGRLASLAPGGGPGLTVVPALTLIQAAIRHISYEIAKVPSLGDVRKDRPLPSTDSHTVLYLDLSV